MLTTRPGLRTFLSRNAATCISRSIATILSTPPHPNGVCSFTSAAMKGGQSFKSTRGVWEKKNPLDFFHVCPLLHNEQMSDGGGRPVHKFVFACPGKAEALVS